MTFKDKQVTLYAMAVNGGLTAAPNNGGRLPGMVAASPR